MRGIDVFVVGFAFRISFIMLFGSVLSSAWPKLQQTPQLIRQPYLLKFYQKLNENGQISFCKAENQTVWNHFEKCVQLAAEKVMDDTFKKFKSGVAKTKCNDIIFDIIAQLQKHEFSVNTNISVDEQNVIDKIWECNINATFVEKKFKKKLGVCIICVTMHNKNLKIVTKKKFK